MNIDQPFIDQFPAKMALIDQQMNDLAFNKALLSIWELISSANKYIDDTAPLGAGQRRGPESASWYGHVQPARSRATRSA